MMVAPIKVSTQVAKIARQKSHEHHIVLMIGHIIRKRKFAGSKTMQNWKTSKSRKDRNRKNIQKRRSVLCKSQRDR